MKVGLIDVDSKIPNLALMKIAAYHKSLGDQISFYSPLFDKPDLVYASKVFKFSDDYLYYPSHCDVIKGGSGYGLDNVLPKEIENICPDYDLYNEPYAMGFCTRGCIRSCGFCIVPKKEGRIRATSDIYEFLNGREYFMLMDSNLTAEPDHFERICKQLIKHRVNTYFSQGLDIRLMDADKADLLNRVRPWDGKRIHFAWDFMADEQAVKEGIQLVTKYIKPHKIMFYVLIGWDTTEDEDLYRVELLRSYKIMPFVMPYDKFDYYQRSFARWVNHKAIFNSCSWPEYRKKLKGAMVV
ncbi:hypothetical protein [Desulfitobacterium hafniense]|uniref:hypothetical protein n=1 Tax=Desulfitobacterium hafniense TaxID=49338 RepID=UPI00037091FC|nr:hypothetical protein [Desulfitobacterium hafniense]